MEPLWMERQHAGREIDRQLGLPAFPTWKVLEKEAEEFKVRALAGKEQWPPPVAFEADRSARWEIVPSADRFSAENLLCFSELPSIRNYLTHYSSMMPSMLSIEKHWHLVLHHRYSVRMWERFGRLVYVIDPTTFSLLTQTQLPKMPSSELVIPRQAFYVKLPDNAFYFNVSIDKTPQPVEGVIVSFSTVEPGPKEVVMLVVGHSPHNFMDDNVIFMSFKLTPDRTLESLVEDRLSGMIDTGALEVGYDTPKAVFGLLLYLMSEHPRLEPVSPLPRKDLSVIQNPGKRRKLEQRYEKTSTLGYIYVGGREPETDVVGTGTGRKLDHQVWVSGHWRRQPYGPKSALRKTIWIKPTLRGPDQAESMAIAVKKIQGAKEK